jgi:F-type H+-transporting ATPase subunit epsilon
MMAADLILLEVATPERLLLKEQVSEVEVPGEGGVLGILPHHAPLISQLGCGVLVYTVAGVKRYAAVCGGLVEVLPDHVRVLARRSEFADEIDAKRAEEALKRANERLLNPLPGLDVARAVNAMNRAKARLACASHAGPSGVRK